MSEQSGPIIVMIALNSPRLPSRVTILNAFRERCPDCQAAESGGEEEGTMMFELDGDLAFVSLMPAPIPWSELEGPCETSWWWPEATERMKPRTHHAIVAFMGQPGDIVQRHIYLSQFVSAVAMNADAAGIYWGNGTVVHEPAAFQDQASHLALDEVDPQLWIDMRLEQNDDDSYRYFTTGLTAFGRPEIEIDRSKQDPQEILEFCYAIICYILNSGATIGDGETIGRLDEEKIRVAYKPSMFDREGDVMKLAYA
jgi:hypothetical protein